MKRIMESNIIHYYERRDELLSKFKDGSNRFRQSPLFNQVIKALLNGTDVHEMIDHLITITENTQNEFAKYLNEGPPPTVVVVDDINKYKGNEAIKVDKWPMMDGGGLKSINFIDSDKAYTKCENCEEFFDNKNGHPFNTVCDECFNKIAF